MTKCQKISRRFKSIAGAALVGFGIFILCGSPVCAGALPARGAGLNDSEAIGGLPSIVLALSQVFQAIDRQDYLLWLCKQIFVACWPLLLVMVGKALLWCTLTDDLDAPRRKNFCLCRSDDRLFDVKVEVRSDPDIRLNQN